MKNNGMKYLILSLIEISITIAILNSEVYSFPSPKAILPEFSFLRLPPECTAFLANPISTPILTIQDIGICPPLPCLFCPIMLARPCESHKQTIHKNSSRTKFPRVSARVGNVGIAPRLY